ncbi:hypothetical protein A4X13_0g7999, partial [Tilletia indica]
MFQTERRLPIDSASPPLAGPTRREGVVIALDTPASTGTGRAYQSHVPLTTQLSINDTTSQLSSSLLDTGASLSSIDADYLRQLGGTPSGTPMRVNGIGTAESLGWATITFFLPAHDSRGQPVFLECSLDFHVLPNFKPKLCLGLDFIESQGVQIDVKNDRATIGRYTISVSEKMPAPFAKSAEICTRAPCFLPANAATWVPVDVACLAPGLDYTIHPRLSVTADESVLLTGPVAVTSNSLRYLLLSNFGSSGIHLDRRTPVADADVAHLGDISETAAHSFTLGTPLPPGSIMSAVAQHGTTATPATPESESPAIPPDIFEEQPDDANTLARDAKTVLVDGHFKVGVDDSGEAPPALVDVLRQHSGAFALDGRPGLVAGEEMEIQLKPDATLHAEPPRKASPEKRAAMDAAIEQLLDWDVIEPSNSPVSFPVLMVRQRDKWRFCVDYRQLNEVTVSDRYPLPTIDAVFHTLLGKRWFSSLDAIRGYHQQSVKSEDRWKTAFVCHRGLYQYRRVPFGLKNAPSIFQRLMDKLLGHLRWKEAIVYIDDIVVATLTLVEHLRALSTLLSRAEEAGLKFSPSKCTFGIPSLTLLGRKVSGAGVAIWTERAKAVQDLPQPRTLKDLYHALGLFGYYRAFIHKFAEIAEPLTRLTRGWRYDRVNDRYQLIDASGTPTSAEKVQLTWTAEQQESFARLKHIIANPPTLAHPDPSRPYVLYVDASKQAFAAILHQVFAERETTPAVNVLQPPLPPGSISKERWAAWTRADPHFRGIWRSVTAAETLPDAEWVLRDGFLVRRADGRFALPAAALPVLLRAVHDANGHFGFSKTYLALTRHFWRPGLVEAVQAWIRHCGICNQTKLGRRVGELDIDNDAQLPFDAIATDLLLGMPRSRTGKDAVLVIQDLFSRMLLLHPCSSSIDAVGIAAIISDRVLRYGWRPRRLISDSEAKMTGSTMQQLAESLGARVTPSPPHHQQANAVERSIQTVKHVLQALCRDGHAYWDTRAIPAAELALNSTPNITTGYRPFDLVFVAHPDIVHAVFDVSDPQGVGSFPERLAMANARLEDARRATMSARSLQKSRYDARRAPLPTLV